MKILRQGNLLVLFLNLILLTLHAQSPADTIEVIRTKKVIYFKQHGELLKFKKLYKILSQNTNSGVEIKKAKRARLAGNLIGFTGAVMSGLFLEGLVKGNIQNSIPVGGGLGLMICTIPLTKAKIRHMDKAVIIFNQSLRN